MRPPGPLAMVAAAAVLAFSATGGGVFAEKNKFCEYPPRGPTGSYGVPRTWGPGARAPACTHTHAHAHTRLGASMNL